MSRWRDQLGDPMPCARCGRLADSTDLDRLLWCDRCVEAARDRAGRIGWRVGLVLALLLAGWIWFVIRPSDLVLGGWIATLVAAAWLGSRLTREIVYGIDRASDPPGGEAAGRSAGDPATDGGGTR